MPATELFQRCACAPVLCARRSSPGLNLEADVVVRDMAFATRLREQIDHLMQQRCERVRLPAPGPLRRSWHAARRKGDAHDPHARGGGRGVGGGW